MACEAPRLHRPYWQVECRKHNHSAFGGYRRTESDYSEVICTVCGAKWRTKAEYVGRLPDHFLGRHAHGRL